MTPPFQRILSKTRMLANGLFGRLLLISLATAFIVLLIVGAAMQRIETYQPSKVVSQQLLALLLPAPPPSPRALREVAVRTGWMLVVAGPEFSWASTAGARSPAELEREAPAAPFDFFWVGGERWLVYRQGPWTYYASGFKIPFSQGTKLVIGGALFALLLVFYLSYRAIRWLFAPIRQLRSGADRIAGGDLEYRVSSRRRDELGALTASVNAMADRLLQTLEEKRQLLLAMGHEIRTPLTRIKLLLEMLPAGEDRGQIVRNLDEINTLVATLLDAEALSGGFVALDRTQVALEPFLRECADISGQPISVRVEANLPAVFLDRVRMRIVLRNLLANAFKYGGQTVELQAEKSGERLRISVSDDGCGIDAETVEKLGRPFFRPDSARSRKTGGHGLGLFLSKTIVESHGGRMTVASQKDRGTRVTIELPWT